MSSKILTADEIRNIHNVNISEFEIDSLCDSHEALRAERDAALEEIRAVYCGMGLRSCGDGSCRICKQFGESKSVDVRDVMAQLFKDS